MSSRFPQSSLDRMNANLVKMGSPYGIVFNRNVLLSNSRMSLEANEYAKEKGKFHEFHEKVFKAYFTEGKDIGKIETLKNIASTVGLDETELEGRLNSGTYKNVLASTTEEAHNYDINSAPTFIIDEKYAIVGAQPLEAFKNALLDIEKELG